MHVRKIASACALEHMTFYIGIQCDVLLPAPTQLLVLFIHRSQV